MYHYGHICHIYYLITDRLKLLYLISKSIYKKISPLFWYFSKTVVEENNWLVDYFING
jgi:hypothetical protein